MTPRSPLTLWLIAALAIFAAAGCRSSSSSKTPTPAPTSGLTAVGTSSRPPVATPEPTIDARIRRIDLGKDAAVTSLLSDTGGKLVASEVLFADLTGDGVEEAVVPADSGGTLGDMAFVVLAPDGAGVKLLLREFPQGAAAAGLAVRVEGGKLIMTQPVPGPDDPECCPTQLRDTTYEWDGGALKAGAVRTFPNPTGGIKRTPVAAASPPPPGANGSP
jgi:hypothetical protein